MMLSIIVYDNITIKWACRLTIICPKGSVYAIFEYTASTWVAIATCTIIHL